MLRVERKNRLGAEVPPLRRRSYWLRDLVRLASAVLCLGFGALAVAWALPQHRQLEEKERMLMRVLKAEEAIRKEKEKEEILYRALLDRDLDFVETEARDRLNRCRSGERVFRFPR